MQTFQSNVQALLSVDNNQRNNAEQTLNQFALSDIENFTKCCLTAITQEDLPQSLRTNSIILLKKNLVVGKNKPSLFLNLSTESKA